MRKKATMEEFLAVLGKERGEVELTTHNVDAANEAAGKGLVRIETWEHVTKGWPYTQKVAIDLRR